MRWRFDFYKYTAPPYLYKYLYTYTNIRARILQVQSFHVFHKITIVRIVLNRIGQRTFFASSVETKTCQPLTEITCTVYFHNIFLLCITVASAQWAPCYRELFLIS